MTAIETDQDVPTIKVLGHGDPMGEMSSETYRVEINGTEYLWERWATHNSSGEEWYSAVGEHIAERDLPFDLDFEDADRLNEVLSAYLAAYAEAAERLGLERIREQCERAASAAVEALE